jgi:hypothetical protein
MGGFETGAARLLNPREDGRQFEMTWTLLGPNVEETKAIWRLEAADGPVLAIPTRSDGN